MTRNNRETEQVFMLTDLTRIYPVFTELVPVKRGVFSSVLYRIMHPFIDQSIKISTFHRLDFLVIIPIRGH
jgi:hypothetical protein